MPKTAKMGDKTYYDSEKLKGKLKGLDKLIFHELIEDIRDMKLGMAATCIRIRPALSTCGGNP